MAVGQRVEELGQLRGLVGLVGGLADRVLKRGVVHQIP